MSSRPHSSALERATSPESRVLFLTAGGASNDDEIGARLRGSINWPRLARMALCEGAAGIVYRRLLGLATDPAFGEIDRHLRPIGLVSEFQLAMLQQQFERLVVALDAAGIGVVLLKGAGLASTVYAGFAERPMTDVDLLVSPDAAQEAYAVATGLGWAHRADVSRDRGYDAHQHLPPLEDGFGIGVGLELHTELFVRENPFRFTAAEMRGRSRGVDRVGIPHGARVPDLHDQLLHACLHFVWSHEMRFGAWRTFRDVDRIVGTGLVRWGEFTRRAHDARGESCCYWALELARTLTRTDIPEDVLASLRPRGLRAVHAPLARHLAMQLVPSEHACPSTGLSRAAWRAAVQPRRHGHGAVVPWELVAPQGSEAPSRGIDRLGLRKLGRVVRYVSAVVIPVITGA